MIRLKHDGDPGPAPRLFIKEQIQEGELKKEKKTIKCENCKEKVEVLYKLPNDRYACGHCFICSTQAYMPPVRWAREGA